MKKITLLLAMLLCLIPVLGACGGAGSPEAAVTTWMDAVYDDGGTDVEDVYKVKLSWNLEVLELIKSDKEADKFEKAVRNNRDGAKDEINTMEDLDKMLEKAKYDDFDWSYEILYCNEYDEDSKVFETAKKSFKYKKTAVEDELTGYAEVGVLVHQEIETEDGDVITNAEVETFKLFCIDGNWYIDGGWGSDFNFDLDLDEE